jgi:NitT/TauT family transport system substrate-binding protein
VRRDIDFRKAYTLQFVNKGVGLDLRPENLNPKNLNPKNLQPKK